MPKKANRGGVLIEAAIFHPFLLLLFGGILQIGSSLWNAQVISRAVYEGARLAAKTPGMELKLGTSMGTSCTQISSVTYNSAGDPTGINGTHASACAGRTAEFPESLYGHQSVHDRVNFAMALQRLSVGGSPFWTSTVSYDAALNRVTVSVHANMRLIVGTGGVYIPLSATQSLPYLSN